MELDATSAPPHLTGWALAAVGRDLFVFGGSTTSQQKDPLAQSASGSAALYHTDSQETRRAKLAILDASSCTWKIAEVTNIDAVLDHLIYPSAVYDTMSNCIWLFGGDSLWCVHRAASAVGASPPGQSSRTP